MGAFYMKILHTADWHFNERQYGFKQREQDYYNAGRFICRRAIEMNADAVILAGDIFDVVKPSAEAVFHLNEIVKQLHKHNIDVYGIDGNHDMSDNLWLHVCGITPLSLTPIIKNNIAIAGINFSHPQKFLHQIQKLAETKTPIDILVIHQAITELCDFNTSNLFAKEISQYLKHNRIRYVAMGDIHTRKEAEFNGIWFVYPGSIEVTAINETVDKSYHVIEITETTLQFWPEPIPVRPRIMATLTSEEDIDKLKQLLNEYKDPLVDVKFPPNKPEICKKAEILLGATQCLYRILPDTDQKVSTIISKSYERKSAVLNLKDAIAAYFSPESEEAMLISELLSAPENADVIVDNYLKNKGVLMNE